MTSPSAIEARERIRPVVPKLVQLIEEVVYADLWERAALAQRDRSLVTIAALVALRHPDQLSAHLVRGLANGVTAAEISEIITHLAVYAGFPASNVAAQIALPLFVERGLLAETSPAD